MLMLGSKEGNRGSVSSMAVLFHEIAIIEEAFRKLKQGCLSALCPLLRERSPRLTFVPDQLILEAASDMDSSSGSSFNSLLSFCFMGLDYVNVTPIEESQSKSSADDEHMNRPLLLPGAMPRGHDKSPYDGDGIKREFEGQKFYISSVAGVSRGLLILSPSSESYVRLGPGISLASLVSGLDGSLRKSFLGATRSCLEACGRMQVDEWVGFFPARCILLVDACVWTQTAASALSRLQQGERTAMR
jgi:hypothetical protein